MNDRAAIKTTGRRWRTPGRTASRACSRHGSSLIALGVCRADAKIAHFGYEMGEHCSVFVSGVSALTGHPLHGVRRPMARVESAKRRIGHPCLRSAAGLLAFRQLCGFPQPFR